MCALQPAWERLPVRWNAELEPAGGNAEDSLSRIARIAAQACETPCAVIAAIAPHGLTVLASHFDSFTSGDSRWNEAALAACQTAIDVGRALWTDAPGAGGCAAAPLRTRSGAIAGAICVLDRRRRCWTDAQVFLLFELASLVTDQIVSAAGLALAQGEQKYRELFESASDLIYFHDRHGQLLSVNRAIERLTGYSVEDALRLTIFDLIVPEQRGATKDLLFEFYGGRTEPCELTLAARDGRKVVLEVNCRVVFQNGMPAGVQGFGHDITLRKDAEARLREQSRDFAKYSLHLWHLHRMSTTDYDTFEEMLADYLRTGVKVFGASLGVLARVEGSSWRVRAAEPAVERVMELTLPLHGTFCESVVAKRHTLTIENATATPEYIGKLVRSRLRWESYAGTPVFRGGALYGTLLFASDKPRRSPYSLQEREILELMAKSIGRSLTEAAVEDERRRAQALEQDRNTVLEMVAKNEPIEDVIDQLIRMVERQSPDVICSVLLAPEGRLLCAASPALGSDSEESFSDLPGIAPADRNFLAAASCASAPIVSASGETLGIFAMYSRLSAHDVTVNQDLLDTAARLAAIAIEQRELIDKLAHQAQHDSLTGLPNREYFTHRLEEAIAGNPPLLCVIFVDLDRFKQINDTLGHPAGDRLLQEVAARLRNCLRPGDNLARMGGDEFAMLVTNSVSRDEALTVCHELLVSIREPFSIQGHELFITASIGMSFYPMDGDTPAALLRKSDIAMYRVKNQRRDDIECYTQELPAASIEQLELANSLRRALENGELEMHFQPQVLPDSTLDGLEALLSWDHPRLGRISPGQFIPLAEESGLIVPIGAWVLLQACSQGAAWQEAGYPPIHISVNVSAMQFGRPDFVEVVADALARTGFDPHHLELELTESLIMSDVEAAAEQMEQLRALGVRISIDDFGTGYSSLNYLRRLPVDTLKIDQSFVREIEHSAEALALIQTIVVLARNMRLEVIAEGVETRRQFDLLIHAGCDKVQGHLFGAPLPAGDAERILARSRAPHKT